MSLFPHEVVTFFYGKRILPKLQYSCDKREGTLIDELIAREYHTELQVKVKGDRPL